jgi:hypothetical protein
MWNYKKNTQQHAKDQDELFLFNCYEWFVVQFAWPKFHVDNIDEDEYQTKHILIVDEIEQMHTYRCKMNSKHKKEQIDFYTNFI